MKKLLALILALCVITAFSPAAKVSAESAPAFKGLSDPSLLPYVEDTLYESLVEELNSSDYFVENVKAVYISQEYLDEFAYNSKANIFFGYTLAELEAQFQGQKYVFTLGEDNHTTVEAWADYDDTYDRIIHNVAVGTGVILVCVTVSFVTGGVGAPACSMIFTAAAKGSAIGALTGAAFGGVSAGIVKGIETGDMEEALKAAALAGSEGFKWGAISGAISGGTSEAIKLKGATLNGLTMDEAAMIQKESGYPLDVIKGFKTKEQYDICKKAGLMRYEVNGKNALIRKIDLHYIDEFGRTNLQRMQEGLAALDPITGQAYQLHHIGQEMNSTLAILTEAEHMQGGNNQIWHIIGEASKIDRGVFDKQRVEFWKTLSRILLEGGF